MSTPKCQILASHNGGIGVHRVEVDGETGDIALFLFDRHKKDAIILGKRVAPYSTVYRLFRGEVEGAGEWPYPVKFNRFVGTATLVKLDNGHYHINLIDFSPESASVSPALPPLTQGFDLGPVTV